MSIEIAKDGVVRKVSDVKVGISTVIRDVSSGYYQSGGVSRNFFIKTSNIDYFKMSLYRVSIKAPGESSYTANSKPTSYGKTSYGSAPNAEIYLQQNGNVDVYAYKGAGIKFEARIYAVFSNGRSVDINKLYNYSTAPITINGKRRSTFSGSGSFARSLQILSTAFTSFSTTSSAWSVAVEAISSYLSLVITSASATETMTSVLVSVSDLSVSIGDDSYPITLVLE